VAGKTREASVKLTLDGGQYLVEMRKIGDEVETQQKRATKSAGLWGSGISKVGDNFSRLGGAIKNVVGMAATLGGAFSFGAALQQTAALQAEMKSLAVAAADGGATMVNWKELQEETIGTAKEWARANEEVAQSMAMLRDETGDLDFARGTIDEIAKQATRTGKPMSVLTGIVGSLNEQFGITEDQVPEALQAVIEGGRKGGVTIEELSGQLERVGPSAQLAGLRGREGLGQVLGMLNQVEGHVKKPFAAVSKFLDMFASPEFRDKAIKLGVKVGKEGEDPGKMLESIMQKTKGAKKDLAKLFSGEQLKVAVELGKTFEDAFKGAEGTAAQKTQVATDAFNKALTEAGKTARTAAEIEAEARERLQEPQRQLQAAMNELTAAVAQPEIIEAMRELAAMAPAFAKELGKLIKFVAKNPFMAALGGAGLSVGGSFIQGIVGSAAQSFMRQAFAGSAAQAAGGSFAAAAFGPLVMLAAGAALGAAVGMAVQDHIEAADAGRRKRSADKLRAELADEFKKTGTQRALTESEKLVLAEGGKPGEEAPTGTDLGQTRDKFQRDQARRAELKGMGVNLPGGDTEDVLRIGGVTQNNMVDKGLLPESSRPEMIKWGSQLTRDMQELSKTITTATKPAVAGSKSAAAAETERFVDSLRRSVLRVEVINQDQNAGGDATRGPVVLPAPAPK
jgi:hypothetical protein